VADDRRVYSDEEFALILRQAAELAIQGEPSGPSSGGLTLNEMKAAAAQVGLDPALVDRAARSLATRAASSPLERLTGGPVKHDHEARFRITLDETRAARLLSAVRISAGQAGSQDVGHSSSMGVTWHDGGPTEALSVTARPEEEGTSVSVVLDRSGTLAVVAVFSGIGMLLAVLPGMALYREVGSLAMVASIAGMGGVLAAARGYWASSTRKVRERINAVTDTIGQTLVEPESRASVFTTVGDAAALPAPDPSPVGDVKQTGT
jgi:hypothetical protein